MKDIFLQIAGDMFAHDAIFGKDTNDMNAPWRELKDRLASLGYNLTTPDDKSLENCAWILFLDSSSVDGITPSLKNRITSLHRRLLNMEVNSRFTLKRALYKEAVEKNMYERMALFLWEGKVNNPINYTREVLNKFKYIFTWDDDLVDNKKFFKFYLPVPRRAPPKESLPFGQKKLLVNISANRHFRRRNELYSARIKTSAYFDSHYPNDFDLFGAKWHIPVTRWQSYFPFLVPKFSTYRGVTPDKMVTLSQYKFALAYENLANTRGYVTEKIFDALAAQTVPIYWGASNIEEYVDTNAFVDRRRFKNDAELALYLKGMTEKEHETMIEAGQRYLASDRFKKFLSEYFCDRIIEVLNISPIKQ